MSISSTKHKRKSAAITIFILLLLLFGIFNFGMSYLDPPQEYGLAINIGTSDFGNGDPIKKTTKTSTSNVVEKKEEVKELQKPQTESIKEQILTDDNSKEVPVIEKVKQVKKEPIKEVFKIISSKEKTKPKPSKETQEALNNLLNGNSSDGKIIGEGDDNINGVKGKENGDSDSNNYYANKANGFSGNYNLTGREALTKPKEQPDCEEEGIVVVRITVDKTGRVTSAIPGVKGSTNTAVCLLKPAQEAALKTKWNSDNKAPIKQTGTIIYKFSLSK